VIELLGVSVPRSAGGWLLRRVCVRLGHELTVVCSSRADERNAFLDVVAGRCIPTEGRAWVEGIPVMVTTARRLQRRVADPTVSAGAPRTVAGPRVPGDIAGVLRSGHEILLLRDVDVGATADDLRRLLAVIEVLRRVRGIDVVLSVAGLECGRSLAGRLIVIEQGRVVLDATPEDVTNVADVENRITRSTA